MLSHPVGNRVGSRDWLAFGAGLVEKQASSSSHTLQHSRVGPTAWEGGDQILPSTTSAFYPLRGVSGGGGCRDETEPGLKIKMSPTAPFTHPSVPEQSLTGMGSPHSSLSSAQATLFGSVLSGSLEGGQR